MIEIGDAAGTHHFSLSDELGRIELRNDSFQDLIANRREYPLVVVQAEGLVDFGEVLNIRSRQHPKSNGDHLEIF